MQNYVYIQHYTSLGDLGISRDVFVTLGNHVIEHVRNKNKDITDFVISDEVDVNIRNNRVIYTFFITKQPKFNIKSIEKCISDYVNNNLLMICEVVPFEVTLKISNFDEKEEK